MAWRKRSRNSSLERAQIGEQAYDEIGSRPLEREAGHRHAWCQRPASCSSGMADSIDGEDRSLGEAGGDAGGDDGGEDDLAISSCSVTAAN